MQKILISLILPIFLSTSFPLIAMKPEELALQQSPTVLNQELPTDAMSEALIKKYQPSEDCCGAAISRTFCRKKKGKDELQIACLINGNRQVVLTETSRIEKALGTSFQEIFKKRNIMTTTFKIPGWEYNIIAYTKEGEHNALLLLKNMLEDHIKHKGRIRNTRINDYLWGNLLGYKIDDIMLFYQIHAFKEWLGNEGYIGSFLFPGKFPIWPSQCKRDFLYFEKFVWPITSEKFYLREVKQAQDYVNENKKFSNAELLEQIKNLMLKIQ